MIDDGDVSKSTIRLLVFQALKHWPIKPLFCLLYDEDCIVRSAAACELHHRGDADTFERLKGCIADSRPYVREMGAFTLGQLGTPERPFREESIPLLMELLDDTDAEVRATAVSSFGHLFSGDMQRFFIALPSASIQIVRQNYENRRNRQDSRRIGYS